MLSKAARGKILMEKVNVPESMILKHRTFVFHISMNIKHDFTSFLLFISNTSKKLHQSLERFIKKNCSNTKERSRTFIQPFVSTLLSHF